MRFVSALYLLLSNEELKHRRICKTGVFTDQLGSRVLRDTPTHTHNIERGRDKHTKHEEMEKTQESEEATFCTHSRFVFFSKGTTPSKDHS